MRKKSIKELTKNLKVNLHYDLCVYDLNELYSYKDTYTTIVNAFRYGYLQGSKATKKEMSVKEREGVYA